MSSYGLSPELQEMARNIESMMLQALASTGQRTVAQRCGLSESTVSRWKEGDLEKVAVSLAAMGLKVVPADAEVVRAEDLEALIHGHREWAASLSSTVLVNRASQA